MRSKITMLLYGPILGQMLAISTLPIISQLYSPKQMGSFQLMLSFCNMLGIVTALSLERTLLLDLGKMRLATLHRLAVRAVMVTSLAAIPIYLLYTHFVETAPKVVAGVPVVIFMALTVLFRGTFLVEYTHAIAGERDKLASFAIFAKDVVRIGARIGLGLTALNPVGLFIAVILDWSTGTALLRRWKQTRSRIRSGMHWKALLRYREYPLIYVPSAALTALSSEAPVLLLGIFYAVHDVGLYVLAFMMLDRPSRIVAKAAGDVLTYSLSRASMGQERRNVVFNALLLVSFDLLALLGIAAVIHSIESWLLGANWIGVGQLAFACVPHALALFVSEVSLGLFAAVAKLSTGLTRQVGSVLALCAGFWLAYALSWPFALAIVAAGIAHLIVQLGFLVWLGRHCRVATSTAQN